MGFFHQPGPVCKAARLAFSGSNTHLKAYTRRKRKETLDEIMKLARTINETLAPTTPRHTRAASRLAVETRLLRYGVITVCQNTKASPSFQLNNSHKQMVGTLARTQTPWKNCQGDVMDAQADCCLSGYSTVIGKRLYWIHR